MSSFYFSIGLFGVRDKNGMYFFLWMVRRVGPTKITCVVQLILGAVKAAFDALDDTKSTR